MLPLPSPIETPRSSSFLLTDGVTTLYGISIPVPSNVSLIESATSSSLIISTGLNHLERITLLGLPNLLSCVATGPACQAVSPTVSFAPSALYPLVSSLLGITPLTTTIFGLLYADENWSLSGDNDVWMYGLYAAGTEVPLSFLRINFPVFLSIRSGLSSASSHSPMLLPFCKVYFPSSPLILVAIGGYNLPSINAIARYTSTCS